MKAYSVGVWVVVALLIVTSPGCQCQVSTANIRDAKMAKDKDGNEPATVFAPTDTFYCVLRLANAPDDTVVKAVWTAVEAQGTEPGFKINETPKETSSAAVNFSLSNSDPWPPGKYKVDLYLNDKLDQTLEFTVAAPTGG